MPEKEKLPVVVQHYISQALLKLFSENNQSVYELNLQNQKIYQEGIRRTMSSKRTYEHPFLAGNTLENAFKTVEDEYIPQIKEAVAALDNNEVQAAQSIIERNLASVLLFYYRSGASLCEFRNHGEYGQESVINNMLRRIADGRYLSKLSTTVIHDYTFVAVKSSEARLVLSDQYVSTASLNCKGQIINFPNRAIGFSNCLIMIPLSAKYYILYCNGAFPLSKPIVEGAIYELSPDDLHNINKAIVRNSYSKCVAMHQEELEDIQAYQSHTSGPGGAVMKYEDGSYRSYTIKKEVFYFDCDEEMYRMYVQYFSQLKGFEKSNGRHIGRNDRCLCGSGKKYKNCCIKKYEQAEYLARMLQSKQTDWIHTKSNFVEMPINEFWGMEDDLPKSSQRYIQAFRDTGVTIDSGI